MNRKQFDNLRKDPINKTFIEKYKDIANLDELYQDIRKEYSETPIGDFPLKMYDIIYMYSNIQEYRIKEKYKKIINTYEGMSRRELLKRIFTFR